MSVDANFASKPRSEYVQIATANTVRDGTGTAPVLIAGVAAGTRVDELRVEATVATTAGCIRFFISKDGGTTKRLFKEVPVPAITPNIATGVTAWQSGAIQFDSLFLGDANTGIYVSTHIAETFNVFAFGGDF